MESYSTPYRASVSTVNFALDVLGVAEFWAQIYRMHLLWLPIGKTSGITKSSFSNCISWIRTSLRGLLYSGWKSLGDINYGYL